MECNITTLYPSGSTICPPEMLNHICGKKNKRKKENTTTRKPQLPRTTQTGHLTVFPWSLFCHSGYGSTSILRVSQTPAQKKQKNEKKRKETCNKFSVCIINMVCNMYWWIISVGKFSWIFNKIFGASQPLKDHSQAFLVCFTACFYYA